MEILNDLGSLLLALGIVAVGAVVVLVVFLAFFLTLERLENKAGIRWMRGR